MPLIAFKELDDLSQIQAQKEAYLRSLVFPMDSCGEAAVAVQQGDTASSNLIKDWRSSL